MRQEEFLKCCQEVSEGVERYVEHTGLHQTGKVISGKEDGFEVIVKGEKKFWPSCECIQTTTTSSYKRFDPERTFGG